MLPFVLVLAWTFARQWRRSHCRKRRLSADGVLHSLVSVLLPSISAFAVSYGVSQRHACGIVGYLAQAAIQ